MLEVFDRLAIACAAAAMLLMASCSTPRVQNPNPYAGAALPPPVELAVYDFDLAPGLVQLDQGIAARLRRARSNAPPGLAERQAAQQTRAVLADELTQRLQSYGLPAVRQPIGAAPPPGSLAIRGQITALNQGNRTRRLVIGFGAGRSSISAEAWLYTLTRRHRPRLVTEFQGSSDSGRMPGAAGTMGVGTAAGRVATSAAMSGAMHAGNEIRRTGDDANALRLADALAKKIGGFAASQGWIAPSAVR